MDKRGTFRHRLVRVLHTGKDLIVHLHQLGGVACGIVCLRRNEGYHVAHIARDAAYGYHRIPVALQMSDLDASGNVRRSEDAHDTADVLGGIGIDSQDLRPGVLASDRAGEKHAVEVDVVRIDRFSRGLVLNVHARDALADEPVPVVGQPEVLVQHPAGQLDRLDDLHIARAAADVVSDGVPYLGFRRIGIHIQEALRAQDHARGAEAALDGSRLAERLCVELLLGIGQTLQGHDRIS